MDSDIPSGLAGIRGSIAALVTPMGADGSLDLEAMDRLLEWHIASGTHAVVVAGTTGESATLGDHERSALLARCLHTAAGRIPVIAGSGNNCTAETLHRSAEARRLGAAACMLVTPYYNRPSQQGLYQHFRRVAETVDIPLILYNVPGRTACDLEDETLLRLAELDNIQGIKDARGDEARGLALLQHLQGRLALYSGEDRLNLPLLRGGAVGAVSVTANVVPAAMARLCDGALAGDFEAAADIDRSLAALNESLFCQSNPMPVKWALQRMGRIGPGIRLPLVELEARFRVQVTAALQEAGIELPPPPSTSDETTDHEPPQS